MVALLKFFCGGEQVSIVLVPWELMLFWGMGVEFKGKIMSSYFREVEWQQGSLQELGLLLGSGIAAGYHYTIWILCV